MSKSFTLAITLLGHLLKGKWERKVGKIALDMKSVKKERVYLFFKEDKTFWQKATDWPCRRGLEYPLTLPSAEASD